MLGDPTLGISSKFKFARMSIDQDPTRDRQRDRLPKCQMPSSGRSWGHSPLKGLLSSIQFSEINQKANSPPQPHPHLPSETQVATALQMPLESAARFSASP